MLRKHVGSLMRRVARLVGPTTSVQRELSRRSLANDIGVSPRTISRWISGEDNPSSESVEMIEEWLDEYGG